MPLPASRAQKIEPYAVLTVGASTQTFYLGDCLEVFGALPRGYVSAIVTSPPYNLGVRYHSYDDSIPRRDYLTWTDNWVGAAAGALAPHGSLFLNVGAIPSDPWAAMDVARTARNHLTLQNTIHWIKSIAIDKDAIGIAVTLERDLAVGHYKPINSARFVNDCHEFVFHFTPGGRTPLDRRAVGVEYQDPSNIARWRTGGSNRRCRGNTWFIPYETIKNRDKDRPHPATFPSRLAEYCYRLHGRDRIAIAMDPFLGLGSSAIAAADLQIDFIGVELDEYYLKEAIGRVKAALNAKGLFELRPRKRKKSPGLRRSPGVSARRRA
jgi:site-specific DNA-methyltransferase (adenine-specific)